MNARGLLAAALGVCVLAAGSATAAGAGVPTTAALAGEPAAAGVPVTAAPAGEPAGAACQRDHVYVFLVNGIDPFYMCQFNKLPEYLRSLGYEHVSLGQLTAESSFVDEIRRIRASDPDARIALLGFSAGASTVCHMTHTLDKEGSQVDLLVYLGGCMIYNCDNSRPRNACRIINIRDGGLVTLTGGIVHAEDVDGVENIKLPGVAFHLGTPGSQVTRDILAEALAQLSAGVPVPAPH